MTTRDFGEEEKKRFCLGGESKEASSVLKSESSFPLTVALRRPHDRSREFKHSSDEAAGSKNTTQVNPSEQSNRHGRSRKARATTQNCITRRPGAAVIHGGGALMSQATAIQGPGLAMHPTNVSAFTADPRKSSWQLPDAMRCLLYPALILASIGCINQFLNMIR